MCCWNLLQLNSMRNLPGGYILLFFLFFELTSTLQSCGSGTFSSIAGATRCLAHQDCDYGFEVVTEPTVENDRVCAGCEADFYADTINAPNCVPCPQSMTSDPRAAICHFDVSSCAAGTYADTVNDECRTCPDGTFTATNGEPSCHNHTVCHPGNM